jgi:hypothetical protein
MGCATSRVIEKVETKKEIIKEQNDGYKNKNKRTNESNQIEQFPAIPAGRTKQEGIYKTARKEEKHGENPKDPSNEGKRELIDTQKYNKDDEEELGDDQH